MSYATVSDYVALYDTACSDDRLSAFLAKASRKIDAALLMHGASVPETPDATITAALSDVCCDMVHRVLGDSAGANMPDSVVQYSQAQGGFSESFTFSAPYSDLSVRDDELRWLLSLLGIDASGVGTYLWGGEVEEESCEG